MNKFKILLTAMSVIALAMPMVACGDKDDAPDNPSYAQHRNEENASVKKGVCLSRYNYGKDIDANRNRNLTLAQSAEKVADLECGWYWNWSYQPNNPYISDNTEFVPTIWGRYDVNDAVLNSVKQGYEDGKYTHLLTFNEPDMADQANISVDTALSYWDRLEEIGIPLGAPAVSWYDKTNGHPWLNEFMEKAEAQGKRVDFIAIHIYQAFYDSSAVNDLKSTLNALYDRYGLPIWLTEFSARDDAGRDNGTLMPGANKTNSIKYMTQAISMLEQCGYVERYSWFLDNFASLYGDDRPFEMPYGTLFNDDDTISDLGKEFKKISSNYPLVLETLSLPNAKKNKSYSHTISVCGGTGNYTFSATGLPSGLSISKSGVISGKTDKTGTFSVKVTVNDSGKSGRRQTLTHSYSIKIS